jgi:hypothetical protein
MKKNITGLRRGEWNFRQQEVVKQLVENYQVLFLVEHRFVPVWQDKTCPF